MVSWLRLVGPAAPTSLLSLRPQNEPAVGGGLAYGLGASCPKLLHVRWARFDTCLEGAPSFSKHLHRPVLVDIGALSQLAHRLPDCLVTSTVACHVLCVHAS